MSLPPRVTLVEVGPRDGLQDLSTPPRTADKIAFIDLLSEAGVPVVEVGAFVDPRRVPAMADTEAVGPVRRRGRSCVGTVERRPVPRVLRERGDEIDSEFRITYKLLSG